MERKARIRKFVLPAFGLILSVSGFSRLIGNGNIRIIHMVYLIMIGVFLGILLQSVITHLRGSSALDN